MEQQFGSWVAAAVYGGTANGSGSQANVAGSISLAISEGDTGAITGNIYGGGDASKEVLPGRFHPYCPR
ncbi:MAG: hypothetical protein ACLVJO_02280 [[Clostridium] scindens]